MKKPETGMSFINQKLQSVVKIWPQNTRIEFQSEILDYIKTLQVRYLGENTVSGPIDFHSHAMGSKTIWLPTSTFLFLCFTQERKSLERH